MLLFGIFKICTLKELIQKKSEPLFLLSFIYLFSLILAFFMHCVSAQKAAIVNSCVCLTHTGSLIYFISFFRACSTGVNSFVLQTGMFKSCQVVFC